MNQTIIPSTTIATFVIRFWRETTADEEYWRGRIEHVQSGESVSFIDFDAMLGFLRHFGIGAQDHDSLGGKRLEKPVGLGEQG